LQVAAVGSAHTPLTHCENVSQVEAPSIGQGSPSATTVGQVFVSNVVP
jgi:hypothetical protein